MSLKANPPSLNEIFAFELSFEGVKAFPMTAGFSPRVKHAFFKILE